MSDDAENTAILQVRDLCKDYPMGEITVQALKHVDLDLFEAQMTVLLGASGSGKSTLLNIIGGLDVATSGTVRYRNQDLSQFSDRQLTEYRRSHVGFVFQFYNLISSLTARENVALVTDICADPMAPAEALELVGLSDRLDHFPSQLSGGEQQRVAIARAIAKRPQILLCDEPTGALDAKTGQLVLGVLDHVNRETSTTTAIITHNAAIGNLGDVVIRMSSGEIVERVVNEKRMAVEAIEW
ncbi:MAG: ABC transporter ATP-binding protein [Gammaproteobacteria bacterium]|nr:ABC transporter ATP-binding protein [Pseudomonadales bacterium]MCP5347930.1 ABC transporter ATP-binding protein [Pseudomonadales bacterium]